jgi:Ser/Thr protein kinase RdoA (MazF antagonist)
VSVAPPHAAALKAVAQRFALDSDAVAPLAGGSRNHLYRLGRPPRAVAVRIAGAGDTQLGVCREGELVAQRAAADAGLAPRVLWTDPAAGVKVDEWLPGGAWSREQARRPESIERVARWLRALHALPPPAGLRRVDFETALRRYCALLPAGRAPATLLAEAGECRVRLGEPSRLVLCHHDLHHANMVDTGEELRVVDWEYAGLGDPMMDLAGFAAYQELDPGRSRALLESYGVTPDACAERLAAARRLFEIVAQAWTEAASLCSAIKKQS